MVVTSKLEGIDGRAPPGVASVAYFDSPDPDILRIDRWMMFHDFMGGDAWPFLVSG